MFKTSPKHFFFPFLNPKNLFFGPRPAARKISVKLITSRKVPVAPPNTPSSSKPSPSPRFPPRHKRLADEPNVTPISPTKPAPVTNRASFRHVRMRRSAKMHRPLPTTAPRKHQRVHNPIFDYSMPDVASTSTPTSTEEVQEPPQLSPADVDRIFLQQMAKLKLDHAFHTELAAARCLADRAVADAPALSKARAEKVAKAKQERARLQALRHAQTRRSKMRLLQRAQAQALKDARMEAEALARQARREQRTKEDEERRQRAIMEERRQRAIMEAQRAKEEEERRQRAIMEAQRAKEAEERRQRAFMEEQQRAQAALLEQQRAEAAAAAKAAHAALLRHFEIYEAKWEALKGDVGSLQARELPWPILSTITNVSELTHAAIREFVLHPMRRSMEGKTPRERVKAEMLRWHPDKYDGRVIGKVVPDQREELKEAAGRVARILTQMMEELDTA